MNKAEELGLNLHNRTVRLEQELNSLKAFADFMLGVSFDGGGIDGADIQEKGAELGLLREQEMQEPCGEDCACAEVCDFPTTCYRKTYETIEQHRKSRL